MSQGEGTIINGAGAQTGSNLSRWGDYSAMTVDPVDGCTFWYANEYIPANGAFNWRTRIGTFKLPGCGGTPPPNDFSISASPSAVSATQNGSATSTIATAVTSGSAQTVSLGASGLPSGATATGTYTVTVTGTAPSATHSTAVTLTVTAPPASGITNGGFESGLTGWTTVGSATTSSTAHGGLASGMVGSSAPFNGDSSVS